MLHPFNLLPTITGYFCLKRKIAVSNPIQYQRCIYRSYSLSRKFDRQIDDLIFRQSSGLFLYCGQPRSSLGKHRYTMKLITVLQIKLFSIPIVHPRKYNDRKQSEIL